MSAFLLALVILLLRVVLLCIGHVRNCCPDAYHETPTSCVSQSRLKSGAVDRGGAGLLSWNIYNASSAIYYAVPVQGLSGQAESAAMSTHQRCHLAPQASNQSPKDSTLPLSSPLPFSLSAVERFMYSSYGGPDGNFIVRRATAKLRPH